MAFLSSYKELIVWQRAIELTNEIYELTTTFPKDERFGLISQMRRAVISIPSNIAEGRHRGTRRDFIHFLDIAYASAAELETQMLISKKLLHIDQKDFIRAENLLIQTMKMLNSMIRKLKADS